MQGESTLIDAQLLNDLLDALMHLLRNAVDHGIEPSQERLAARKPAHGTIELSFAAIGSHISIACSDDGRGFDLDNIRRKAIHANLIAEDAQLTAEQTMRLILHSGFSTREQTTHISGRGLGMSIVNQAVLALRGSLEIGTSAAGGSSFNMRLPVQMSAKHVMLSRSSTQRIALSERGLEQLLPADRSRFERTEQGPVYLLGEDRLPVLRLDQLLGMPLHAMLGTTELETVMIVTNAQRTRSAVIGPELSESRRVIVKPLGGFVPPQAGIDGLAMLGDGSICSVVDLPDLIASYVAAGAPQPQISAAPDIKALPLCMVVDDSVSVRRTMEQLMQDAGYQVITARDGLDALSLLDRCTPDIALVDLEMPRMNGLDLTKSMRNRPLTKDTPVVMITSRFTDKHRALATEAGVNEFLTKPYTEDVLLGLVGKLLQPVFTAHSA